MNLTCKHQHGQQIFTIRLFSLNKIQQHMPAHLLLRTPLKDHLTQLAMERSSMEGQQQVQSQQPHLDIFTKRMCLSLISTINQFKQKPTLTISFQLEIQMASLLSLSCQRAQWSMFFTKEQAFEQN